MPILCIAHVGSDCSSVVMPTSTARTSTAMDPFSSSIPPTDGNRLSYIIGMTIPSLLHWEIYSSSSAGVVAGCTTLLIAVIVSGMAVILGCVKRHKTGDGSRLQIIVEHYTHNWNTENAFGSGAQHTVDSYRAPCGSTSADKSSLCHCSEIIWNDQDTVLPCI